MGLSRQVAQERSLKSCESDDRLKTAQRPLSRFKSKYMSYKSEKEMKRCRKPYVSKKSCFFFENLPKKTKSLKTISSIKGLRSNLESHLGNTIKSLKDKYLDKEKSPYKIFMEHSKRLYNKVQSNIKDGVRSGTESSNVFMSKSRNIFGGNRLEVLSASSQNVLNPVNKNFQKPKRNTTDQFITSKSLKCGSKHIESKKTLSNALDNSTLEEFDRDIVNKNRRNMKVESTHNKTKKLNNNEGDDCEKENFLASASKSVVPVLKRLSDVILSGLSMDDVQNKACGCGSKGKILKNCSSLKHFLEQQRKMSKKSKKDQKTKTKVSEKSAEKKKEPKTSKEKIKSIHRSNKDRNNDELKYKKPRSKKDEEEKDKSKVIKDEKKELKSKRSNSTASLRKEIVPNENKNLEKNKSEKDPSKELKTKDSTKKERTKKGDKHLERNKSDEEPHATSNELKDKTSKTKESTKKEKGKKGDKHLEQNKSDEEPHATSNELKDKTSKTEESTKKEKGKKGDKHLEQNKSDEEPHATSNELKDKTSKRKDSTKKGKAKEGNKHLEQNKSDEEPHATSNELKDETSKTKDSIKKETAKKGGKHLELNKSDEELNATSNKLKDKKSETKASTKKDKNKKGDKHLEQNKSGEESNATRKESKVKKSTQKDSTKNEKVRKRDESIEINKIGSEFDKNDNSSSGKVKKYKDEQFKSKASTKVVEREQGIEKSRIHHQSKMNRQTSLNSNRVNKKEKHKVLDELMTSSKEDPLKYSNVTDEIIKTSNTHQDVIRDDKKSSGNITQTSNNNNTNAQSGDDNTNNKHKEGAKSENITNESQKADKSDQPSLHYSLQKDIGSVIDMSYNTKDKSKTVPTALQRSELTHRKKSKEVHDLDANKKYKTLERTLEGATGDSNKIHETKNEDNLQPSTVQNNKVRPMALPDKSKQSKRAKVKKHVNIEDDAKEKQLLYSSNLSSDNKITDQRIISRDLNLNKFKDSQQKSSESTVQNDTQRNRPRKYTSDSYEKNLGTSRTSSLLFKIRSVVSLVKENRNLDKFLLFCTKQIQWLKDLKAKDDNKIKMDPNFKKSSLLQSIVNFTNKNLHVLDKRKQYKQNVLNLSAKVQRSIKDLTIFKNSSKNEKSRDTENYTKNKTVMRVDSEHDNRHNFYQDEENYKTPLNKPTHSDNQNPQKIRDKRNIQIKVDKCVEHNKSVNSLHGVKPRQNGRERILSRPLTKSGQLSESDQMIYHHKGTTLVTNKEHKSLQSKEHTPLVPNGSDIKQQNIHHLPNKMIPDDIKYILVRQKINGNISPQWSAKESSSDTPLYDIDSTVSCKTENKKKQYIQTKGYQKPVKKQKTKKLVYRQRCEEEDDDRLEGKIGFFQKWGLKMEEIKNKLYANGKQVDESADDCEQAWTELDLKRSCTGEALQYQTCQDQRDDDYSFYKDRNTRIPNLKKRSADYQLVSNSDENYCKHSYRNRNIAVAAVTTHSAQPKFKKNIPTKNIKGKKSIVICEEDPVKKTKKVAQKIEPLNTKARFERMFWIGCDQELLRKATMNNYKESSKRVVCFPISQVFRNCCLMCRNCLGLCCAVLTSLPCVGIVCMTCL